MIKQKRKGLLLKKSLGIVKKHITKQNMHKTQKSNCWKKNRKEDKTKAAPFFLLNTRIDTKEKIKDF